MSELDDKIKMPDANTLSLCDCDGLWHIGAPDQSPAVYLEDYVQERVTAAQTEAIEAFAAELKATATIKRNEYGQYWAGPFSADIDRLLAERREGR